MYSKSISRRNIGLVFALLMLVLPAFITSAVGSAQSRSKTKPTPTPKKKATPTPKRAKATPTPKKNQPKTAKTTPKNTKTGKTQAKTATSKTDKNSKADKNKNSKTASKTTRNDKNTSKSNSKTVKTPVKTPAKTAPKTVAKTTVKKPATTVKKESTVKPMVDGPQIIVTSFSVPVRNEARSNAPTISRIKIGTVLRVTEKNPAWYKVQYQSGGKSSSGWVSANVVDDLNASDRKQLYRQIVEKSYRPELDFLAAAELFEFMDGISGELDKTDASGELELKRLMVLRSALRQIAVGQKDTAPYRDFLKNHDRAIVYNEPAGVYLVTANQFWDLHTKYQKSVVSDSIAWEAALNPLPGECEGYVNCYLFDLRMRFGEYLNHHPSGKHSAEALTNIANYLEPIVADSNRKEVYNGPTDVTDRAEFNNLIAELRTIVARLGFVEKERTLQQLKQIAEAYR
ncbi:MAG: SH3 domain-containing protein [Acidobacteria bacterium]|nr:SH3 domain-containing protein [Acidobacteriota bacterium]